MPLNFPNNPLIGDQYNSGSIVFEWDGVAWQAVASVSNTTSALVSGTPVDNQVAVFVTADTIEGDANITWDGTSLNVNQPAATTRGSIRALGGFYDYGSSGNGGYGGFSASLTTGGAEFEAYGGTAANPAFFDFNANDTTTGDVTVRFFRDTNTSGAVEMIMYDGDGTDDPLHYFSRTSVNLLQNGGQLIVNNPVGATLGTVRTLGGIYDYASSGNGGYGAFEAALSTGGAEFRAYQGSPTASTFVDFNAPELTTGNFDVRLFRGTNTTGSVELVLYNGDGTSNYTHRFTGSQTEIAGDVKVGSVGGSVLVTLEVDGTDAILVPVGTTAQRPGSPTAGMMRYNSDRGHFEMYTASGWIAANPPDYTQNKIINGSLQVWQRGTSSSTGGYQTADRWTVSLVNGSVTQTQANFILGEKFGRSNPKFALQVAISGQVGVDSVGLLQQRIEDVRTYADQTVTVIGWARRSAGAGNMSIELEQDFGSGGTPSARTFVNCGQVALTGSWAPFAVTGTLASLTGKTIGTNNDSSTRLNFWLSAGSDYDARTGSLGIQTITVQFYGIHILPGVHDVSVADYYLEPDLSDEIAKCQRYFTKSYNIDVAPGTVTVLGALGYKTWGANSFHYFGKTYYPVTMRRTPTLQGYNPATGSTTDAIRASTGVNLPVSAENTSDNGFCAFVNNVSVAAGVTLTLHYTADAEI